jgi:carbonic anhydrase
VYFLKHLLLKMKHQLFVVVVMFVAIIEIAQLATTHWSYEDIGTYLLVVSHNKNILDNWPGICQTGTQQSPVDLPLWTTATTVCPPSPLDFVNYDHSIRYMDMKNNGHTVGKCLLRAYFVTVLLYRIYTCQ